MKKAVLKTILRDFFKLKYPLAMILVIVVLGAGVVWATGGINNQLNGYRSNHNTAGIPATASTTSGSRAVIIGNTAASSDYFVPTRTPNEWTAFLTHCPAGVTVTPVCPAGSYYDSSIRCNDTCLICPADYYCTGGQKYSCISGLSSPVGSTSSADCLLTLPTCVPACSNGFFCNPQGYCQANCYIDNNQVVCPAYSL